MWFWLLGPRNCVTAVTWDAFEKMVFGVLVTSGDG